MEIIELNGKKYAELDAESEGLLAVGRKVYIRTITYHHIGLVTHVDDKEVRLAQSSWVAESARWSECLREGKLNEVEPAPPGDEMGISRAAIVDYFSWSHALPTKAI